MTENTNGAPGEFSQARALREKLVEDKKETRKRLGALSFTEKIKILEKLRDRSRAFAEARRKRIEAKDSRHDAPAEVQN